MKVSERKIEEELSVLKNVVTRDPNATVRGRNLFLAETRKLSQRVSTGSQQRHMSWNEKFPIQQRKGRFAMVTIISTIIVAFALIFGGTGVVQAAQSSMPTDALYAVKLWTEDFTASITSDPENLVNLYFDFADRRIEEMANQIQAGESIQERVITRFMAEIENALKATADIPNSDLEPAFLKIQQRLLTQDLLMLQLKTLGTAQNEPLMNMLQQMIQDRLRLVESGLGDLIQLRETIRQQDRLQDQLNAPTDAQPGQMNGEANGNGSYQMTPPPAGTGGNNFGSGSVNGQNPENGDTPGLQQGICTCLPTPTGTVVYLDGTPIPTYCVCLDGFGNGSFPQGTPIPGGNGQGGKP